MRDVLLVAIGAVPGAWLRFRLVNHFEPMLPRRHWATFSVNITACFALGLISALARICGGGGAGRGLALHRLGRSLWLHAAAARLFLSLVEIVGGAVSMVQDRWWQAH